MLLNRRLKLKKSLEIDSPSRGRKPVDTLLELKGIGDV